MGNKLMRNKLYFKYISLKYYKFKNKLNNNIGDWGLGIGDWAQSPIPNPQSPNINYDFYNVEILISNKDVLY